MGIRRIDSTPPNNESLDESQAKRSAEEVFNAVCCTRKVTSGITELSHARVHIDHESCFLDVV